jgi:hypothetical protein
MFKSHRFAAKIRIDGHNQPPSTNFDKNVKFRESLTVGQLRIN